MVEFLHLSRPALPVLLPRKQQSRRKPFGPNDAATVKRSPLWLQFLARFGNPLVIILLIASAVSAATGDVASFVIIFCIVMLSIILISSRKSGRRMRSRRCASRSPCRRPFGATARAVSVPIDHLVPGDIVELIAGDLVPADSRLLESRDLYVNQALLTGEPYPAEKQASDAASGAENPAGASNAVFAGTSVISGTATILICRTGSRTALGHLATSLAEKPPATAFAVGIRRFGMLIMRFTVLMVLFVLVVNISFHRPVLESLMFARRARRRPDARVAADDRYGHAGPIRDADGEAKGDREAPVRDPRSGRHERAVHRQDRHADGSHDQAGAHDRRPRCRERIALTPMPSSTASSRAA